MMTTWWGIHGQGKGGEHNDKWLCGGNEDDGKIFLSGVEAIGYRDEVKITSDDNERRPPRKDEDQG